MRRVRSVPGWCGALALVSGCGGGSGSGPFAPGSVPQGAPCQYASDCAPVDGGYPSCGCTVGVAGSPRCGAYFDVPISCEGTVCTADQSCVIPGGCMPSAAEGASCVGLNCLPGLFCNAASVCEMPHGLGQACEPGIQQWCAPPAFCDATTLVCNAPRGVGEACDFFDTEQTECSAGLSCSAVTNTCTAPQLDGAPCMPGDDAACLSSYCPAGRCETKQCHG